METMTTPYYALPEGGTLNDILWGKPFWKGNIIKYIWRAGDKPGVEELEDLKKAQDCLNNRIEKLQARLEKLNNASMWETIKERSRERADILSKVKWGVESQEESTYWYPATQYRVCNPFEVDHKTIMGMNEEEFRDYRRALAFAIHPGLKPKEKDESHKAKVYTVSFTGDAEEIDIV